jgi:hypothetical protein
LALRELELLVDKRATGVQLEEPGASAAGEAASPWGLTDLSWLWWVVIGVVLLFLIAR